MFEFANETHPTLLKTLPTYIQRKIQFSSLELHQVQIIKLVELLFVENQSASYRGPYFNDARLMSSQMYILGSVHASLGLWGGDI